MPSNPKLPIHASYSFAPQSSEEKGQMIKSQFSSELLENESKLKKKNITGDDQEENVIPKHGRPSLDQEKIK